MLDLSRLKNHFQWLPALPGQQLEDAFLKRYPRIPQPYLDFLQSLSWLCTHDETSWFNNIQDFNGASPEAAFAWNEFENLSLDALNGDIAAQQAIRTFWDQHLPIALSVKDRYAYLAIGTGSDNWGRIFYGDEPEYEEAQQIASSFTQWLQDLMHHHPDEKTAAFFLPGHEAP